MKFGQLKALFSSLMRKNLDKTDRIGETDFGNPEGTNDVGPATVVGLLKGATAVRAQSTVDGARRRLQAAPTQPLALGDVRHTVTLLNSIQWLLN